ncbi:prepilin peptidase [Pseudooceanicola nanhaiensis]|jgi:prepilin peptidase CpaA|uniref:Membrane protein n=1 Tax=Pseudooceanicola nanhaiensis TaxID=375761 RepID=A0A917WGX4_9RHOB|nr:prepilin peptidase [Pseudooceanicola nanhaiensis]GGM02494.1 membrane protein [Pseudooceanicola nanhaiensis]
MEIDSLTALVLAIPAIPLSLYTCWSDLRGMRIPNGTVLLLAGAFVVLGPFLMPFETYLWRLAQLGVMLVLGILANAGGLVGAGDAKFVAAAAPYIAAGDLRFVLALFTANLLAAFATHRLAKHSGLRRLAPDWESWSRGRDFPMGLALGGTLSLYLLLGIFLGG